MKKILILLLLLPSMLFAQNSYIVLEAQYDSYGATESQFFITDIYGDTIYHHAPNTVDEYLYDTLQTTAQALTITLLDSYGDGWQDSNMAGYFRAWNSCQDTLVDFQCGPSNGFATEILSFNLGPCSPNAPPPPCVPATVIINLDQYQNETSWEIADTNGTVVASGMGYGAQPDYATIVIPVCIPAGPLTFTIMDSYGDGLNGLIWQGNDGSYFLKQCNDTLVYGTDPAFGLDTTHAFVSDTCPVISGCIDNNYIEFDPLATVDDGSCLTLKIFGCTDSSMYNWVPSANTMAMTDSCLFKLTLHDLVGNGWIGSSLKIYALGDTIEYIHSGGFTDVYYMTLPAPILITAQFFINGQASLTTIECGFTITNIDGDTMVDVQPPFIQPLSLYHVITNCGNECIEKVYGCLDPLAINYDSLANTNTTCFYIPGCTNSSYLEYYTQGFVADTSDNSCLTQAIWGCIDSTQFNYDSLANIDNGGCLPVILGCMESLAFNFEPLANTPDTCIAVVEGCMSSIALNYDSLANIDNGSCIGVVYGCIDTLAFNYAPMANVDDGGCIDIIYGCINPTQFNYDSLANTNNGSCIPYIYGCTDSTMFNYNPLANADNSSCAPFIYGCTDPSMLNYDPLSNTEDFTCIEYLYGCMDEEALNFDSLANTENNSCIDIISGCMDPNAYNYSDSANVNSYNCNYDAGCITGPGTPYWLNDPCYAWVISVDDYCCENEWDGVCQLTYDYCDGTYVGDIPARKAITKKLIAITDLLGRPAKEGKNKLLFYIYSDGTVEKKITKTIN